MWYRKKARISIKDDENLDFDNLRNVIFIVGLK